MLLDKYNYKSIFKEIWKVIERYAKALRYEETVKNLERYRER